MTAAGYTLHVPAGTPAVTLRQLHAIVNPATKNKAYLQTRSGPIVAEYLAWYAMGRRSERTLDQYERDLSRLVLALSDLQPEEIGVEELMLVLQLIPPGSWKRARAAWGGFFKWLVRSSRIGLNPVELLPPVKADSPVVHRIFSAAERHALVAAAGRSPLPIFDRARMLLLLETGARKGEAMGLRVEHIDLTALGVILHGKGNKERFVPISGEVVQALELMMWTELPRLSRTLRAGDHLWFPYKRHADKILACWPERPMSRRGWHEWYARLAKAALGVDYRKPHMARHTYATDVLDATRDLHAVKELLGHASVATTELYIHSSRRRLQSAVSDLARFRGGEQ